VKKNNTSVN